MFLFCFCFLLFDPSDLVRQQEWFDEQDRLDSFNLDIQRKGVFVLGDIYLTEPPRISQIPYHPSGEIAIGEIKPAGGLPPCLFLLFHKMGASTYVIFRCS